MYVISYDISVDKLRKKISDTLSNYGKRVQYSVFECDITIKQFEELYEKLTLLVAKDEGGSVRFYNICARCQEKITILGVEEKSLENEEVIVI